MINIREFSKRCLIWVLCIVFLIESLPLSVFALETVEDCPITDEQIVQALQNATFIDTNEASTFNLINTQVNSSDEDYFPATADREEAEKYNSSIATDANEVEEYNLNTLWTSTDATNAMVLSEIPGDDMVYYTSEMA